MSSKDMEEIISASISDFDCEFFSGTNKLTTPVQGEPATHLVKPTKLAKSAYIRSPHVLHVCPTEHEFS
jgi:hypothetical protein